MAFQIKPVQKIDNLEDLKKKYRAGDKITESQKRKMRKSTHGKVGPGSSLRTESTCS